MIGRVCSLGAQQSVGCWSVGKEVIALEQEKFERIAQRGAAFASGAVLEMCKLGCASVSASDEHNFFIAPVLARLRQENRFVASEPLKFIQKFLLRALDDLAGSITLLVPLERGFLELGIRSTYIWDCKLKLNFVPTSTKAAAGKPVALRRIPGRRVEFFCRLECA